MDINKICIKNIDEHLRYFCSYEKLSGEPDALKTVEYIKSHLDSYNIPCKIDSFMAYLSNPVSSRLMVQGEEIPSRPRSFSGCCKEGIKAELVFDSATRGLQKTELEKAEFYKKVRGKIVVGYGFDERYAKILEMHGAAGWIQVWSTDEALIHEDTVSPVWGTPDMDSCFLLLHMPVVGITRQSGEVLIRRIEEAPRGIYGTLSVEVETAVKEVQLPVAEIQGKTDDFVLLSNHYDTWYIGAFDNCSANAAALEIARVLKLYEKELNNSVRIAWWPGHSNGRYMGSTWYCDHYYQELHQHCMASLNSDLIGARGTDTLVFRTTGAEGRDFLEAIKEEISPGTEIKYLSVGRGADQSFFGADIPYHINPRFETRERTYATPGSGGDFWHTAEDTYDKIDLEVLEKEAKVLGFLTYTLAAEGVLPYDVDGYFDYLLGCLKQMEEKADKEFDVKAIREKYEEVRLLLKSVLEMEQSEEERAAVIKEGFGTLNRLFQSSGSPYEQDTAFAYGPFHLLAESCSLKKGETPEDIYLFYKTTFIRQKNRMITELNRLIEYLESRGKDERAD